MLRRTTLFLVVLALAATTIASAQLPGTLFGNVSDRATGEQLAGVQIVISDPERPNFRQEAATDENGRYSIFLTDSTVFYNFAFTKAGYRPFNQIRYKVISRSRTRENFTMNALDSTLADDADSVEVVSEATELKIKGSHISIYNRGVGAEDAGDIGAAEIYFTEALAKKADYGPAHGGLARVFMKQEKWSPALEHAAQSLELNPSDVEIYQVVYASNSALGNKKEAQAALAKLAEANPEKAGKNLFNQAADFYNQGNMEEARPLFEQLLMTDPNNGKAHYMLGLCYISASENELAKEHLNQFLSIAPNDPDAETAKEMLSYLE